MTGQQFCIERPRCASVSDKMVRQAVGKTLTTLHWQHLGMNQELWLKVFTYQTPYHKLQAQEILEDMMNSPDVQTQLRNSASGMPEPGVCGTADSEQPRVSVSYNTVPACATNMSMFDRLSDSGIMRKDGVIIKCMEDYIDGIQVSDKLRDMLLNPDSDNAELYSPEDRDELLFCIFQHLCLGGSVNQFEDDIDAYLRVSKAIYKDLVSVHRNSATSKIEVSSAVYQLQTICPGQLFPHKGRNNFCYVSVDTHKRQYDSSEEDTKHVMKHAVQHVADVAETFAYRQMLKLIEHIGDRYDTVLAGAVSGSP